MIVVGDQLGLVFLLLAGCVSGFASGLLGVGGGTVIVPALILGLPLMGVTGPEIPKIAMATSLALIVPTSIASTQAHAARAAIDWPLFLLLTPSLVAGAFAATAFAAGFNVHVLTLVFVAFALFTAWGLMRRDCVKPVEARGEARRPCLFAVAVKGMTGGAFSAVMGIGGAFFTVPILARFVAMPRAIGTASALALPMAIAGAGGYLLAGKPAGCEAGCAGYIFFPAVMLTGMSAVLAAPFGAWLAHVMPVVTLRRVFALFLIFAAANLAFKTLSLSAMTTEATRLIAAAGRYVQPRCPLARASHAFPLRPEDAPVFLAALFGPRRAYLPLLRGEQPATPSLRPLILPTAPDPLSW